MHSLYQIPRCCSPTSDGRSTVNNSPTISSIYQRRDGLWRSLITQITRIDGVLNYWPLVAMSNDPNDLSVLIPGHFLIGQPIMTISELGIIDVPKNRLRLWQLIKQAHQSFWKRWSREYLHTLQSIQKWFSLNPSLDVGDVFAINKTLFNNAVTTSLSPYKS